MANFLLSKLKKKNVVVLEQVNNKEYWIYIEFEQDEMIVCEPIEIKNQDYFEDDSLTNEKICQWLCENKYTRWSIEKDQVEKALTNPAGILLKQYLKKK